ncbi:SDR family oxidoreductase [Arenivirga flava]|uniref:Oxidoreductase n=1 Tax=Arenivirga flava TaxID=1930060 RepID=A0AA37XBR9_9MICO|nr:SDR family NAD(P)-dependent oxidoreductase [Arenivirga flava]GMA28725.1 oxidoreductase [Arenivirga flava]
MDITASTVFIPGATSGIGLGLALRLQAAGSTVVVGGRRTERLAAIAAEHPGIGTVEIDTADPASIERARDEVVSRHPGLDAVVLMAGIMEAEEFKDPASLEIAERTVVTNLLGPIRLVHAFLPQLRAQGSATIMTVSSGLASVPLAATPTYNATKAGIHSLSETLRVQLETTGVRVVELAPPATRTDLMGLKDNPTALPLEDFLDEVMTILGAQPDVAEVLVERVKWQRFAEREGRYDEVFEALSSRYRG